MSIKIGLVGCGTVGGGCVDLIQRHREDFKRRLGIDIELARVCSRTFEKVEAHGAGDLFTSNYEEVINDPSIDIVLELMGGTTLAKEVVLSALKAGKNVVTANKALIATHGKEILECAAEANKEFAFEASVGGGIPIIQPLKHALISNEIMSVMGIVNGTTNYMLTRMTEDGISYEDVLKEAQDLGYAEANPSADVDGYDAAAKIAILSSIAFNSRVTLDDVFTEGISHLTTTDLESAAEMGYCVKLLAIANRREEGIEVRVHPTMLPLSHQLASVNGADNAIFVVGDFVGETMFYGPGAGAGPTASAVMGDVLEVARHIQQGIAPIVGCTCTDDLSIMPIEHLVSEYYLRFVVADRCGVLAAIAGVFAKNGVSVRSVVQKGKSGASKVNLVFVTHRATEENIQKVINEIRQLEDVTVEEPVIIRVEG